MLRDATVRLHPKLSNMSVTLPAFINSVALFSVSSLHRHNQLILMYLTTMKTISNCFQLREETLHRIWSPKSSTVRNSGLKANNLFR